MSEVGELSALAQEGVNTALQVLVVLIVCFIGYLLIGRKSGGFRKFIGLVAPPRGGMRAGLIAAIIFMLLTISVFYFTPLREVAAADNTIAAAMRRNGFTRETGALILLVAFVKTAFAEELFFRGLIAKRLINVLGMSVGNTLHALIFGAVHLVIFAVPGGPAFTPVAALTVAGVPALLGWVMAWINEAKGGGSIAPSWLLHGITNAAAYPVIAFG